MTDKAYIVANEQQEREVLEKLEREGLRWIGGKYVPSNSSCVEFPYVLFKRNKICWGNLEDLSDEEIVFDGRKEEHMSDKYVVSQEFMDELEWWKINLPRVGTYYIDDENIYELPSTIRNWWKDDTHALKQNNRLIAIIRWVNGEDVFEVENPKKWLVRSKETNSTYCYAQLLSENNNTVFMGYSFANATRFDTREEAESWANAHQEVVEVVDV